VGNILGSRLFAEWGTRNLLGTGRGLQLSTEYGYDLFEGETVAFNSMQFRNNFWRYDIEYFQRYLFGLKILMSINAYIQKDATVQNVVVRRVGGQLLSRRRLGRYSDILVGFTDEFIKRVVLGTVESEGEVRFLTSGLSIDKRDLILNPRTGVYRFLRLKFAGGFLGGDYDFYTANVSSQWYWRLLRNDVVAVRVRIGYGDNFGQSDRVPIEDRFFAGGVNSVRGYKNNSLGPKIVDEETGDFIPLGGNALLLTNVEMRFDIPLLSRINISGSAFFDGGNVWEDVKDIQINDFRIFKPDSDVDINDYRYGLGIGIRYNTPLGPIRLDYGLPIKVEEGQSRSGLFYLALGQTF
jgi:outer membrane protein insertion porin family